MASGNVISDAITQISTDPSIQPLLPFLFVLAVIYGLLTIVGIFKKKDGRSMASVNFIIALVFAFFAAGYQPFVSFFFTEMGIILWAFLLIFFIAFVLEAIGLRGKKKIEKEKADIPIMMGGIVVLLLVSFGFSYLSEFNIPLLGTENFMILAGLVLLVFMLYYAYEFGRGGGGP